MKESLGLEPNGAVRAKLWHAKLESVDLTSSKLTRMSVSLTSGAKLSKFTLLQLEISKYTLQSFLNCFRGIAIGARKFEKISYKVLTIVRVRVVIGMQS